MASNVVLNGSTYSIPAEGDSGWGTNVSNYLIAIASACLQKTGGAFTLTADIDFGATYGIKTPYVKSKGTNPAGTGVIRLANLESVSWRNAANNADLALSVNASNYLTYNSSRIVDHSIATAKGDLIIATASGTLTKLGVGSNNYILVADSAQTEGVKWSSASLLTNVSTITSQDADYSIQLTDYYIRSGDLTLSRLYTLPETSTAIGRSFVIQKTDSSSYYIKVTRYSGSDTMNGTDADLYLARQYETLKIICTALNKWEVIP